MHTPSPSPSRRRGSCRRPTRCAGRANIVVLLAISLLVTVGAGVLGMLVQRQRAAATARQSAADAAAVAAHDFASYDYRRFEADLARAGAHATGEFRARYLRSSGALAASYRQQQLVTTATVLRAGVTSASGDSATVLVFLDQVARGTGPAQPTRAYRLLLRLRASHDHWLVSNVDVL